MVEDTPTHYGPNDFDISWVDIVAQTYDFAHIIAGAQAVPGVSAASGVARVLNATTEAFIANNRIAGGDVRSVQPSNNQVNLSASGEGIYTARSSKLKQQTIHGER